MDAEKENIDTQTAQENIEEKPGAQTGDKIEAQSAGEKDALSSTTTILKPVTTKTDEKRSKTQLADSMRDSRPGSTKRRQYYYKQVADCLMADRGQRFHLYALRLKLTCAIPDDQNTRGRSIFDPVKTWKAF